VFEDLSWEENLESSHPQIPTHELSVDDLPLPDADYKDIVAFAHSFDAYTYCSSGDECAHIANAASERWMDRRWLPASLEELRTCLFFEARRAHHVGEPPEGEWLSYIQALVEAIRSRVIDVRYGDAEPTD
jgi:hypothetical protein